MTIYETYLQEEKLLKVPQTLQLIRSLAFGHKGEEWIESMADYFYPLTKQGNDFIFSKNIEFDKKALKDFIKKRKANDELYLKNKKNPPKENPLDFLGTSLNPWDDWGKQYPLNKLYFQEGVILDKNYKAIEEIQTCHFNDPQKYQDFLEQLIDEETARNILRDFLYTMEKREDRIGGASGPFYFQEAGLPGYFNNNFILEDNIWRLVLLSGCEPKMVEEYWVKSYKFPEVPRTLIIKEEALTKYIMNLVAELKMDEKNSIQTTNDVTNLDLISENIIKQIEARPVFRIAWHCITHVDPKVLEKASGKELETIIDNAANTLSWKEKEKPLAKEEEDPNAKKSDKMLSIKTYASIRYLLATFQQRVSRTFVKLKDLQ